MFSLSHYTYHLPENLIAQEAAHPHHAARLMVVNRESGKLESEDTFWNLDTYLDSDRILCFNDSKVLRSRIPLENVAYMKNDGGSGILKEGEIFFLKDLGNGDFEALVRPGDKFRIGTIFSIGNATMTVINQTDSGRVLHIEEDSIFHLMETHGNLPLPPYIQYDRSKESDYQTSFAKKDGSVAAPTASLHFTRELLDKLPNEKLYTTLHVGLGTFKGIDTDDIREYTIHEESVEISFGMFKRIAELKHEGKKLVAVGTTICRTLESLPYVWEIVTEELRETFDKETIEYWNTLAKNLEPRDWIHNLQISEQDLSSFATDTGELCRDDKMSSSHTLYLIPYISFSTSIYITPGYEFRVIDDLITNFHLPESSLLVLVSAFMGNREVMELYEQAIKKKYRFYSFGDGMYIRGGK